MSTEKLAEINQQTAVAVSAKVSPAAHPDAIVTFGDVLCAGDGGPGQIGYSTGRSALKALYQGSIDVDDAHASLLTPHASGQRGPNGAPVPSMEVPVERRAELAALINGKAARVASHVQRCADRIGESIAMLEDRVGVALTHPNQNQPCVVAEQQQIRDYVRSLKQTERTGWLQSRIDKGDRAVIAAVIGPADPMRAPSPWISGLTPEQQSLLRQFAADKFAPVESKQLAALKQVQSQVMKACEVFANVIAVKMPKVVEDKRSAAALAKLKE